VPPAEGNQEPPERSEIIIWLRVQPPLNWIGGESQDQGVQCSRPIPFPTGETISSLTAHPHGQYLFPIGFGNRAATP
jgi:hypothetical protein